MRYSNWEQRQLDIASGEEMDKHQTEQTHQTKQTDIYYASFRVQSETPGHITFGIWVNGGKCGDLTLRQSEKVAFTQMLLRAGFIQNPDLNP